VLEVIGEWPVLRVPAVLRGTGEAVDCVLETWQEESTSGRLSTRCRIVDDPVELPDGPYTLGASGQCVGQGCIVPQQFQQPARVKWLRQHLKVVPVSPCPLQQFCA